MHTHFNSLAGAAILAAAVIASGCSTTHSFVDYSKGSLYSTDTVGNVPFVEVGPVSASNRGFFWEGCAAMAEEAVADLKLQAEEHGANHVSGVRWLNHADGSYGEKPICTTGWGWFVAPPVIGGFMPWVKATELQGRLVLADEQSLGKLHKDVDTRITARLEKIRVEEERLKAEKERLKAEETRLEAEADRLKQEEKDRKKAEKERLKAEEARLEAEEDARKAEEKRKRQAAEAAAKTPSP